MNNKYFIFMIMLLLVSTLVSSASMTTVDGLKYNMIYETDPAWCSGLYILVSGINITSDEYYLNSCAQSDVKNKWYCNCEIDDEFEIYFVNREDDTKTYIIDIKSGKSNVRRVISINNLESMAKNKTPKPDIEKFEFDTTNLNKQIAANNNKITTNDKRIININRQITTLQNSNKVEQIVNQTILYETVESNYNDSALNNKLATLEIKTAKNKKSLLIGDGILAIIAVYIIVTEFRSSRNRKKPKQ